MKKVLLGLIALFVIAFASGCGTEEAEGETEALNEDHLKVGVTAGPHEQVMEKVKEVAAKQGLEIELQVFNEYVMPNLALDEGELDANSFQHQPYLDQFNKDRGLDIVSVAKTVNFPMGIYSEKVKDVSEIKEGDKIGLPNDPTNGARALILFEQAGLIKLKEDAGVAATVKDIAENPKNLEFIELEAAQIPRQLGELKAAAINTNFAIEHGFVPTEDSIFIEPKDSPWVNVIAVRSENKNDPAIDKLIQAYQSDEVKQHIKTQFKGSVIAGW
ncbi:MetQ/NlpA family ABC transporter substrate-binding protein [Bacillus tianshenii]|nr:MetQ/NlpA family ABC transporter substrate-binding protein [Bacillus tianshenii]